jgi:centrosomal protein CEP290
MRQQGWKIERVTKENRALELQNVELRKQSADVRAENLEVSECVILTTQCDGKEQRAGAA